MGVLRPPSGGGGGGRGVSIGAVACGLRFLLTCALLMTSSHSEGREVLRTFVSNVGVDGAPAMAPQQLMEWVASVVVRCLPVVPFVLKFVFGVGGPPPPTLSSPIFLASAALGVASVSACFAYAALVSASASAYFASAALVSASGSAFLTSAALASDGPSSTPPTSPRTSDKGMQSATFPSASALSPSTAAPSPAVTTPQSPAFVGGGAETEASDSNQVVIVGGGIGGVVLALTLQKFRIPFRIVKRYPEDGADGGADLALWPSAAAVLQDLGLADKEWWDADTYRVRHSYIATHDGGSATVTKGAVVPDPSTDLTRLSMDRVVGEDSVGFRLVERRKLLERLRALLPVGQASYNCTVEKITSSRDGVKVIGSVQDDNEISCMQTFNGRIAVGADGIKSCCRRYVVAGNDTPIRFGGEVCYRGIVQLDGDNGGEGGASGTSDGTGLRRRRVSDDGHEASPGLAELFAENESMKPESFTIHYGEKTRSAWGYVRKRAHCSRLAALTAHYSLPAAHRARCPLLVLWCVVYIFSPLS